MRRFVLKSLDESSSLGRAFFSIKEKNRLFLSKRKRIPFLKIPEKAPSFPLQEDEVGGSCTANISGDIRSFPHYTSFPSVLYWLNGIGKRVVASSQDREEEKRVYEVEGKVLSTTQLLYFANRLRREAHLPIFYVHNITEM